jgi:hypothetical protein
MILWPRKSERPKCQRRRWGKVVKTKPCDDADDGRQRGGDTLQGNEGGGHIARGVGGGGHIAREGGGHIARERGEQTSWRLREDVRRF